MPAQAKTAMSYLPYGRQPVTGRWTLMSVTLTCEQKTMPPRSKETGKPIPHVAGEETQAWSWGMTHPKSQSPGELRFVAMRFLSTPSGYS